MAYTTINYKTKKALKNAVAVAVMSKQEYPVTAYQPGLGPDLSHYTGRVTLEGPHYPAPHTWYASVELVDGKVVKVK